MTERYLIVKDSVLEEYLVTPEVLEDIFERFDNFVTHFIEYRHKRVQRQITFDYMKGPTPDTERKNVVSIADDPENMISLANSLLVAVNERSLL